MTHNHGTESDPNFQGYANGNSDPGRGFGHIAVSCDDVEAACARFEQLGVNFKKKLTDGKMRHIAFILDPDKYVIFSLYYTFLPGSYIEFTLFYSYWIEIVPTKLKAGEA